VVATKNRHGLKIQKDETAFPRNQQQSRSHKHGVLGRQNIAKTLNYNPVVEKHLRKEHPNSVKNQTAVRCCHCDRSSLQERRQLRADERTGDTRITKSSAGTNIVILPTPRHRSAAFRETKLRRSIHQLLWFGLRNRRQ